LYPYWPTAGASGVLKHLPEPTQVIPDCTI
jgi:hypothetical protein